jgi:nicotinamide-nucleotide amidase
MEIQKVHAEIVTIGDEILYGQITDTNSQWMSAELDKIGIRIIRKSSVGDNENEILTILSEAEKRADIILITGGLGPTNDDITKKTIAKYFNCGLILDQEALKEVTAFFEKRGRELTEVNKQQAFLPEKATYIPNRWGTAPGMWLEKGNKVFVSMPGVPFEMKGLMTHEIIPRLKSKFNCPVIYHKVIKTAGIGESFLAEKIKTWEDNLPIEMKLAYLPGFDGVKLRLTSFGKDETLLISQTNKELEKLKQLVGSYIYGYDEDTMGSAIGKLLKDKKLSIATAESCSGGYVSHLITLVPGSSSYFLGGVVAYDNRIKVEILGVNVETLREHGAVSEETVKQMAEGVRKKLKTSIGIATTGIAGPDGGSDEKPVGTVWIGYSDSNKTIAKKLVFGKEREVNIRLTGLYLLNFVRESLG